MNRDGINENVRSDCKFAKDNWEDDICNGCKALDDMYCKEDGKCNFYKPKGIRQGKVGK